MDKLNQKKSPSMELSVANAKQSEFGFTLRGELVKCLCVQLSVSDSV